MRVPVLDGWRGGALALLVLILCVPIRAEPCVLCPGPIEDGLCTSCPQNHNPNGVYCCPPPATGPDCLQAPTGVGDVLVSGSFSDMRNNSATLPPNMNLMPLDMDFTTVQPDEAETTAEGMTSETTTEPILDGAPSGDDIDPSAGEVVTDTTTEPATTTATTTESTMSETPGTEDTTPTPGTTDTESTTKQAASNENTTSPPSNGTHEGETGIDPQEEASATPGGNKTLEWKLDLAIIFGNPATWTQETKDKLLLLTVVMVILYNLGCPTLLIWSILIGLYGLKVNIGLTSAAILAAYSWTKGDWMLSGMGMWAAWCYFNGFRLPFIG